MTTFIDGLATFAMLDHWSFHHKLEFLDLVKGGGIGEAAHPPSFAGWAIIFRGWRGRDKVRPASPEAGGYGVKANAGGGLMPLHWFVASGHWWAGSLVDLRRGPGAWAAGWPGRRFWALRGGGNLNHSAGRRYKSDYIRAKSVAEGR